MTETRAEARKARRNPAPWILGGVVVVLALYYAVLALSGATSTAPDVIVSSEEQPTAEDYLTLQLRVQEVDLSNRVINANLLPVAHGNLLGSRAGEMSESLRIEIASGGITTSVVTYPGESIVDPTAVSLVLQRGDYSYPFDRPSSNFQISVRNDETGENVPFQVEMENSSRQWSLTGDGSAPVTQDGNAVYNVTINGTRVLMSVTLALFYVLAILITTLMAVVTIGSAILNKRLEFANVIWLSATMLSFPGLRAAMPGAPPIGTALDFFVVFPCICLIAIMLMWTGGYMLWRESSVLRKGTIEEKESEQHAQTGPLELVEE